MDVQTVPLHHGVIDLWRAKFVRPDHSEEELTHLEVALVRYLNGRPGEPVSRAELLAEVWGYGQSVRTRAVDATVKRLRLKIEGDPRRPEHLRSAHGVGYAFFPANRPVDSAIKSSRDLGARLVDALQRDRLVTLTGPIGVGKSWLCDEVAQRLGGRCVAVDAARFSTVVELSSSVRDAADVSASADDDWLAALGPVTLVLDNADTDAVLPFVSTALDRAPHLRVLLTRRTPVGSPTEQVVVMPTMTTDEGRALYQEQVHKLGLSVSDDDAVRVLVDLLDGLPAYIVLAARQASVRSASELVTALQQRDLSKNTPLTTDLAPVLDALPKDDRETLGVLSLFPDAFDQSAAATVLGCSHAVSVARIEPLVAEHWVSAEVGVPTRYRLLTLVRRVFCCDDDAAIQRFVRWTCDRAKRDKASRVELVTALHYATGDDALFVALALDDADRTTGLASDRQARLCVQLERWSDADPALVLRVLREVARLVGIQGDHATAARWFERALALATERDAQNDIAEIQVSLGSAYRLTDRRDEAVTAARAGYDLAKTLGNSRAQGLGAWCLGTLCRTDNNGEDARRWFLASIEAGTPRSRGMALESLAILSRGERHAIDVPERFFRQAIDELDAAGDVFASGHVSANLGCLYVDAGRLDDARQAFTTTLESGRRVGLGANIAFGIAGLRLCDALQGRALESGLTLSDHASRLARTCDALAWALDAARRSDEAALISALRRAEDVASDTSRDGLSLMRALPTAAFAPQIAEELANTPAGGPLVDALRPLVLARLAGEPTGEALVSAHNQLRGPDRAVLGACLIVLAERLV